MFTLDWMHFFTLHTFTSRARRLTLPSFLSSFLSSLLPSLWNSLPPPKNSSSGFVHILLPVGLSECHCLTGFCRGFFLGHFGDFFSLPQSQKNPSSPPAAHFSRFLSSLPAKRTLGRSERKKFDLSPPRDIDEGLPNKKEKQRERRLPVEVNDVLYFFSTCEQYGSDRG